MKKLNTIKYLLLGAFIVFPLFVSAKTFDKNLYFGITNDPDVQMLQEFLTDQGVYSGPITGNFFSLTLAAVKKYQIQNNITPTAGFFGPITRTKANEILSAQTQSSDSQAIVETGTITPPVTQNTTTNNNQSLMQTLMAQILALMQQITQMQQQSTQTPTQPVQQTPVQTQPTQPTQQTTQQTQVNTQTQSTPTQAQPTQTTQTSPSPASPTDAIPPVIFDVKSTNIAPYSATITWISNEYSDSIVYLGLSSGAYFSSANGSVSAMNSGYFHTVNLSSLTANTKYYYKVTSADNNNNKSTSNEYDFTTIPIPPGSVTVTKNSAVDVIVAMKPTTVTPAVKIGSYIITASLADSVVITNLTFQVANVSYIHNLMVKANGTQFGTIKSIAPAGVYSFAGTPFTIPKGGTVYVDVYADITSSTSGVTTAAITTMTGLVGSGATSLNSITLPSNVPGQDITITITSNLTVTSDAAGIITNGHVRSTTDHMATFVFTADPVNDVTINVVTLHLTGASLAPGSVRLIDSDTGLDWGYATIWNSSIYDSIVFFPNYILSAGATKRIKVQMNTINFIATTGSVNGSLAQWSIANGADATHNYNAVDWSVGSSDHFNIDANKLPIYGPSIRY